MHLPSRCKPLKLLAAQPGDCDVSRVREVVVTCMGCSLLSSIDARLTCNIPSIDGAQVKLKYRASRPSVTSYSDIRHYHRSRREVDVQVYMHIQTMYTTSYTHKKKKREREHGWILKGHSAPSLLSPHGQSSCEADAGCCKSR